MTAFLLALALAAPPPPFDGTWFFDDFRRSGRAESDLAVVWNSPVTVAGDAFTVQNFLRGPKGYAGKLKFDPADPTHVDLILDAIDLTPLGAPLAIPAGPRLGVYQLDGDRLKLVLNRHPNGPRPSGIDQRGDDFMPMSLRRAPAGVTALPKEFEVVVTGPDGQPVPGARVTTHVNFTARATPHESKPLGTTDAAGRAKLATKDFVAGEIAVYDPAGKRLATAPISPAAVVTGTVAVQLAPCREVAVPVTCPELSDGTVNDLNCVIATPTQPFAFAYLPKGGPVRFLAPAGDYKLQLYSRSIASQQVAMTVPPGDGTFNAAPVTVSPNASEFLVGKPAPELEGVVATKGGSARLADYRGKFVVLDFWGYWCGACTQTMPVWIAVHDHFKGEHVAVITVHQDGEGEVPTVEKYDAVIAPFKTKLWKGRDLPFPVALVSGKGDEDSRAAKQYGVTGWPKTILIGPDGKVIGAFDHFEAETAIAALEARVKAMKK